MRSPHPEMDDVGADWSSSGSTQPAGEGNLPQPFDSPSMW
ncbi:hypothetical protein RISK_005768 [Rhodopirellula islandica]|uniref:Uncharacterized protein n=1 Tax=Rhodopirellula islandica TaxID=595434 RepID=A0A0J1B7J8_RHOIS|nr:hypothetical protein RISK_005768 [Rhodopirellula islandica]